ncbi:MAG: hypothetical protein R3293_06845 [Candidatus Promineifilaceae bacterium]|nr:hypothetical protein [Candidatus Promineifilaceae bacterium]
MSTRYGRFSFKTPKWIFDLTDRFARDLGVNGSHPPLLDLPPISVRGEIINGNSIFWAQPPYLVTKSNHSGQFIFFGQMRLPSGELRRNYLQDNHTYILRLESSIYQSIERSIPIGPDPANPPPASSDYQVIPHTDPLDTTPNTVLVTLNLEPGNAYPFPRISNYKPTLLRCEARTAAGLGLADVHITVVGQPEVFYEMTDQTGAAVLVFPDSQPSGDVTIRFTHNSTSIEQVVAIEPAEVNVLPPLEINV